MEDEDDHLYLGYIEVLRERERERERERARERDLALLVFEVTSWSMRMIICNFRLRYTKVRDR